MLKNIILSMRINHYLKNVIIFIPLILSANFYNITTAYKSITTFLSFCLISSAVYIINDIFDKDKDKLLPHKSYRPIACGKIQIKQAILTAAVLFLTGCFFTLCINYKIFIIILFYFLLNLSYSIKLKQLAFIDVICIAAGFMFRVTAGFVAIELKISLLIILLTFFVSLFFTFTKRKLELKVINSQISLKYPNTNTINKLIIIFAILSILFYLFCTLKSDVNSKYIYTTIPFIIVIYRFLHLTNHSETTDPIVFFEKDKILKSFLIIYFVILLFAAL